MARAFVIILHTGLGEDHFDLMLESLPGQPLWTWRIERNCLDLEPGGEMPALRKPDHRQAYLSYEGPVSGGRGQVRRVAKGTYETILEQPGRLVVRFDLADGPAREFELEQHGWPDDWVMKRQKESTK